MNATTYLSPSKTPVKAIQFTGDNEAEILAFADCTRYPIINFPIGPSFVLRLPTGNMQVEIGWYVCRKEGGRIYSVPKDAFERNMELV